MGQSPATVLPFGFQRAAAQAREFPVRRGALFFHLKGVMI